MLQNLNKTKRQNHKLYLKNLKESRANTHIFLDNPVSRSDTKTQRKIA